MHQELKIKQNQIKKLKSLFELVQHFRTGTALLPIDISPEHAKEDSDAASHQQTCRSIQVIMKFRSKN